MKVRGRRECQECGGRWSYYDTGDVACPECGSLHSVGVDEKRSLHTATAATIDLSSIRNDVEDRPLERLADRAAGECREFIRGYGFVDAGELRELDDTYLATMELKHVAAELARRMTVTDDEEWYFTGLLRADEGERPPPSAVPDSLRDMRGLAYANAVREYRADLRTYLREHPDPAAGSVLGRLAEHVKRVRALDGDVPPRQAETLVAVARDVGRYLAATDESALAEAETRLNDLA